jgi:hypothetical protein
MTEQDPKPYAPKPSDRVGQRSQKAPKPPKPRKVERRRPGRKG